MSAHRPPPNSRFSLPAAMISPSYYEPRREKIGLPFFVSAACRLPPRRPWSWDVAGEPEVLRPGVLQDRVVRPGQFRSPFISHRCSEETELLDFDYVCLQRGAGKSTPHACLEENTTWDLVSDIEKLREHLDIPEWQAIATIFFFPSRILLLLWLSVNEFTVVRIV